MPQSLLKYYFPTLEVSDESARERAVISPPLFWLHLWWARRPLIGSRATIAALAVDTSGEPRSDFITQLLQALRLYPRPQRPVYIYQPDRKWILEHSRIAKSRLLDVFAGGGSIPFEALRLGFHEVIAVEYNPVAYIILKATLEYPLKYGSKLVSDVKRWAQWLVDNVRRELKEFYPQHIYGRPTSYIWIRTYRCPHGKLVPSISNPILSKGSKLAIKLVGFKEDKPIIKIVRVDNISRAKETLATVKGNTLQCLRGTIGPGDLKRQYREVMKSWEKEGLYGHHPAVLAVVKLENNQYVTPTDSMIKAYQKAEEHLQKHWEELVSEDLIPTEEIPMGQEVRRLLERGINKFYKLFNARQLLTHAIIVKFIREAYHNIATETRDEDYARAVVTYLALGHGKLLDYNSVLTTWHSGKGVIRNTFSRHAYTFGDDFAEGDFVTPFKGAIDWAFFSITGVVCALDRIVELLKGVDGKVKVVLGDASDPSLYAEVGPVEFVVTDPPYYGNVQYGELSDFFYVWFKRSIGELYPEAFVSDLVPKDREIVVNKAQKKDGEWFEEKMRIVFELIRDSLAENGRVAVMYAHRSSSGLVAMLRALLDAGFSPFAVWSFASEQPHSIHIVGKAAARSLLVLGLEPRPSNGKGVWDARVQAEVVKAIERAIDRSIKYGLTYVDALMATVGAAFNVIGKHWPLVNVSGKEVTFDEVMGFVYKVAARAITRKIVETDIDPESAMYLLARVVYGEPEYDELRRIGYGFGVNHEEFIKKYASKPRQKRDAKVYPLKLVTQISSRDTLVGVIGEAARAYLIGGERAAVKVLTEMGYRLNDERLYRYVELLLEEGIGNNSSKETKEEATALRGLLELLSRVHEHGVVVARSLEADACGKQMKLDEWFSK